MDIEQNGLYFVSGIKEIILSVGGQFNDFKERPVVALLPSINDPNFFWAVPVGDLGHRDDEKIKRIQMYLNFPQKDIRSCFYHIGNTNKKSIFFISDVFPITSDYVSRKYLVFDEKHYIIKNQQLLNDLDGKLRRVLAYEQSKIKQNGRFFFRQNIFGAYAKIKAVSENEITEP